MMEQCSTGARDQHRQDIYVLSCLRRAFVIHSRRVGLSLFNQTTQKTLLCNLMLSFFELQLPLVAQFFVYLEPGI